MTLPRFRPRPRASLAVCVAACFAITSCRDTSTPPPVIAAATDSSDQVMFGVTFFLTDGGLRRATVKADTALMFEENTRTDMRIVNATFFDAEGRQSSTLTARKGTYNTRLGSMEARGDVVVKSSDGRVLASPHLRFDPSRNEVSSDSAFVLTERDKSIIRGIGFISDPDLNAVRVLRGARGSGKRVTLPVK